MRHSHPCRHCKCLPRLLELSVQDLPSAPHSMHGIYTKTPRRVQLLCSSQLLLCTARMTLTHSLHRWRSEVGGAGGQAAAGAGRAGAGGSYGRPVQSAGRPCRAQAQGRCLPPGSCQPHACRPGAPHDTSCPVAFMQLHQLVCIQFTLCLLFDSSVTTLSLKCDSHSVLMTKE